MKTVNMLPAIFTIGVILFFSAGCSQFSQKSENTNENIIVNEVPNTDEPQSDKFVSPAFAVVDAMGVGWNLGNTLDSIDNKKRGIIGEISSKTPEEHYETYWGNPITTMEMIDAVAEAGFGAIRIPVTYSDHMNEDYVIREEWLERVAQVVDYVLDNDIYCIINIHHDTGQGTWPWLKADSDNIGVLKDQFYTVWLQIAEYFKEYGDKLLFEGFNEILDTSDRWTGADISAYNTVNRLNRVFVETVRSTGGKNEGRFLIVNTYAASASHDILDSFVLPGDSADGRLIVGIHYYGVLPFAWKQSQVTWTEAYSDWDIQRDGKPVEDFFMLLHDNLIAEGIPVIIGEFGAQNKRNTGDRTKYATHYIETAKQYGISCFWWDDGGQFSNSDVVDNFTLFDRYSIRWFFPEITAALVDAASHD